jgi:Cysteine-rich CWC
VTERPQPLDPQHCPLCGKANQCAMELAKETGIAQPPCWCTQVSFSPSLLASVPPASQGLACVCRVCATSPHCSN